MKELNPDSQTDPVGTLDLDALPLGVASDVSIPVSESYAGIHLRIPVRIIRGVDPGPTIAVVAALHGDEINGTGAVRELATGSELNITSGTLLLVPVLNLLGFDRHSRYLPDRRDLNRCFPGTPRGSLASRIAYLLFQTLVPRCDAIIDLHTAAVRRTNFPQIRADMSNRAVAALARAFGGEVVIDCRGVPGTLRRESTATGCPTIIFEGGEVWKVEPTIVDTAVRGVKNVLRSHGMLADDAEADPMVLPENQLIVHKTSWVRAERGGFMRFHVSPGDIVCKKQVLATNTNLLGDEVGVLVCPFDGIVIGMTTMPSVSPGEPVCHIAALPVDKTVDGINARRRGGEELVRQTVQDLSSNVRVVDHETQPDTLG